MLKQENSNVITLIPKVIRPQQVTYFRPVLCCNVIYKIVSKILFGRLRRVLELLTFISINQLSYWEE